MTYTVPSSLVDVLAAREELADLRRSTFMLPSMKLGADRVIFLETRKELQCFFDRIMSNAEEVMARCPFTTELPVECEKISTLIAAITADLAF